MINFFQNQTDEKDFSLSLSLGSSSSSHSPPQGPSPSPACFVWPLSSSSSNSFVGSMLRLAPPSLSSADSLSSFSSPPLSNNSFGGSTSPTPNQTTPEMKMTPVNAPVHRSSPESARSRKSVTIAPPYPWATNVRGKIHSLEYLESNKITTITGKFQCQHCENVFEVSYNVRERFEVLKNMFALNKEDMRERAPDEWKTPEATRCEICGHEKVVKPVIAEHKKQINWLFLLLGQTLGHCRMGHLKYFCKHSKSHRTGAKDRLLYLTYLGLCKMLQPNNPLFDRD